MSDQDMAAWTGMAQRAVGLVLALPALRGGVHGGGRGARLTRRIDPKVRNAVAIVQALSESGIPFELAANVATAAPYMLSAVTQLIDFAPPLSSIVMLPVVDPDGGWLSTDLVPQDVWGRQVRPCRDVDNPDPSIGEVYLISADNFRLNTTHGTMVVNRRQFDLDDVELVPLTDGPVYAGEHDPLGFLVGSKTETAPRLDEHLLIVDGKWIVHKSPDPSPLEAMQNWWAGKKPKEEPLTFDFDPIAVIENDRRTVRVIGWGRDEEEQDKARWALEHNAGLLDINMTFSVRRMKRRALGVEA